MSDSVSMHPGIVPCGEVGEKEGAEQQVRDKDRVRVMVGDEDRPER